MTYNPNAVFISPSSISDFDRCPQLYFYRNVYRNPKTGLKIQLINPKLALGQVIHDTLRKFLYSTGLQKTQEQLRSILAWQWKQLAGEKGGFTSADEERTYQDRAAKILERFWAHRHFKETQPVKMPDFPKLDLGEDIILTGRLDWLEKESDGYHIIDFKTGENEERDDSIQLPIYAVLASGILKINKIRASYWYLDKDEEIKGFKLPDLTTTLDKLKKKGAIIKSARITQSFACSSGNESCWACRDFLAIVQGKAKIVSVDPIDRKQEIYIIPKGTIIPSSNESDPRNDLPF